MSYFTDGSLNAKDALGITVSFSKPENVNLLSSVGTEATIYVLASRTYGLQIIKPNKKLREFLGISRTSEWRYRKLLKEHGYL